MAIKLPKWLFWKVKFRVSSKLWRSQRRQDVFIILLGTQFHRGDEYRKNMSHYYAELTLINISFEVAIECGEKYPTYGVR